MAKATVLKGKKLDAHIEQIYYANCRGVQIPILDIGSVFDAGRKAYEQGQDVVAAVLARVAAIRVN